MNIDELHDAIKDHEEWLRTKSVSGKKANFLAYKGVPYWTHDNRCVYLNPKVVNIDGVDLQNVNLSEAILSEITIRNSNLSGAIFNRAQIVRVKFINVNFTNAQFHSANLDGSIFINSNLANVSFERADLRNSVLKKNDLRTVTIRDAKFSRADLQEAILDDLDCRNMELNGANFSGSKLFRINLSGAQLKGTHFDKAVLKGASLNQANFSNATLNDANIEESNLQDAIFEKAILDGSSFEKSRLPGVSFRCAKLRKVNFKQTDLVAVSFEGADLEGADLSLAVLSYAKFDDVLEKKTVRDELTGASQTEEKFFITNLKETNWFDTDATAITLSRAKLSFLPNHIRKIYGNTFIISSLADSFEDENIISRSIEFPLGYEQIGMSILNYFNKILREKYPNLNVGFSICQNGPKVTMTIETPDGTRELIEKTLYDYGLVVTGGLNPDCFLEDGQKVLELKQHLTFIQAQFEANKCLLKYREDQEYNYKNEISYLRGLITDVVQHPAPMQIEIRPSISLEANPTFTMETKNMSQSKIINEGDEYNVGQAGAAGRYACSNNNTFIQSEQKQNLAKYAYEIQSLIEWLEKGNPNATESEKIAYVSNETTPSFKSRVVAALCEGGEAAIEEFLDNPYVNVGKAIVRAWIKPE